MNSEGKFISIISPVYNAENIVDELVERISEEVSRVTDNYEIILVEDGSRDSSWQKIEKNCGRNNKVKGIKLSRNFGQHYALTAGLKYSGGDYVIVMDCDLQHNPAYIKDLLIEANKGNDVVLTKANIRSHPFFKNIFSRIFYLIFNWLTETQNAQASVGSYSLLSRKVVNAYNSFGEYHRHYLLIVKMLGFKLSYIKIKHIPRREGKSSYSLSKLINHAISGITSQSNKLLKLIIGFGLTIVAISFIIAAYIIYGYFEHGFLVGWTSVIVALLLSTGVIMICLGVIGIYIGNIFDEVKNRPLYLVDKKINISSEYQVEK